VFLIKIMQRKKPSSLIWYHMANLIF
jgi:hypothetical protein